MAEDGYVLIRVIEQDEATGAIRRLQGELKALQAQYDTIIRRQGQYAGGIYFQSQAEMLKGAVASQVADIKRLDAEIAVHNRLTAASAANAQRFSQSGMFSQPFRSGAEAASTFTREIRAAEAAVSGLFAQQYRSSVANSIENIGPGFAGQVGTQAAIMRAETALARREAKEQAAEAQSIAKYEFDMETAANARLAVSYRERAKEVIAALRAEDAAKQRQAVFSTQVGADRTQITYTASGRAIEARRLGESVREYTARVREAETATLNWGKAGTHAIPIFDSIEKGQRRQAIASIAAAWRDLGISTAYAIPLIAAAVAVLGTVAVVHGAEKMGEFAQKTVASATAAGMSVSAFSQLQGALSLVGLKSTEADVALRQFARSVAIAIAEPASRAADGFRAFGYTIDELKAKSVDLGLLFSDFATHFASFGGGPNDANKVNAGMAIFNRSLEGAAPLLEKGGVEVERLKKKALDLGITLDDKTAKALIGTGEKANELGKMISGGVIKAFIAWQPQIDTTITDLQNLVKAITAALTWVGNLSGAISRFNLNPLSIGPLSPFMNVINAVKDAGSQIKSLGASITPSDSVRARNLRAAAQQRGEQPFASSGQPEGASYQPKPTVPSIAPAGSQSKVDMAEAHLALAQAKNNTTQIKAAYDQLLTQLAALYGKDSAEYINAEARKITAVEAADKRNASVAAKAARQSWEEFSAAERAKIAATDETEKGILAIYSEWLAQAKSKFGEASKQYQAVLKEMETATKHFNAEHLKATVEKASAADQQANRGARAADLGIQAQQIKGQISPSDVIQREAQITAAVALESEKRWQAIAASAQIGSEAWQKAEDKIAEASENATTKLMQDLKALTEESKQAAEKFAQPFTEAFDKIGEAVQSSINTSIKDMIDGWPKATQQIQYFQATAANGLPIVEERVRSVTAAQELLLHVETSLAQAATDLGLKLAQQFAAQQLGNLLGVQTGVGSQAGESIAGVLGTKISQLFGAGGANASNSVQQATVQIQQQVNTQLQTMQGSLAKVNAALADINTSGGGGGGVPSAGTDTADIANIIGGAITPSGYTESSTATDFSGGVPGGSSGVGTSAGAALTTTAIRTSSDAISSAVQNTGQLTVAQSVENTAIQVATMWATAAFQAAIPKPLGFSGGGIVPSAAGGWMVPGTGGGQLALLHPQEMVLPRDISLGMQEMIGSGRTLTPNASPGDYGGDRPDSGHTFNINLNAIDTQSGAQFLHKNGPAIMQSLSRAAGNGVLTRRSF